MFLNPLPNNGNMISVVLPTYNERENILKLIEHIENVVKRNKLKSEIVVVDDSSPDGTAAAVKALNKNYGNIRVLIRKKKLGVGSAHMFGYQHSNGDVIIAMDTDLSHDPEQIIAMIEKMNEGYDIVAGSRHMKGSYYERKTPETRRKYIASKYGNMLTTFLSGVPIHDFTNGFRAIRKYVVKNVETESTGNSFLMEFLVKAHKKGYRVTEIPVTFKDRKFGHSKLQLEKESLKYIRDLLKYLWT